MGGYTKEEEDQLISLQKQRDNVLKDIAGFESANGMIEPDDIEDCNIGDYYDREYERIMKEEAEYYDELWKKEDELSKQIFNVNYSAGARKRKDNWKTEKETFENGNIINETVSDDELKEDVFCRKQKAASIADLLCDDDVKSPYNIAVLGKWGTGKTSFCRYIINAIREKDNEKQEKESEKKKRKKKGKKTKYFYKVIDYNAAEYSSKVLNEGQGEHIEQQWSNLLKVLLESYEEEHSVLGPFKYNWNHFIMKKPLGRVLLYLLIVCTAFIPLAIVEAASFFWDVSDTLINLFGNVSGIVGALLVLLPIIKNAVNVMGPVSDRVKSATDLPNYLDVLGTRERIVYDLKVLLKSWLIRPEEKIIIFVDDCDRCSVEGIMELFEAMHLFLTFERVFFVFAIDPRLLKEAIAKYYNKNGSNALVDSFLQKYVARSFVLENPDYSNYINNLSTLVEPENNQKHCLSNEEYSSIIALVDKEENTPRSVKQVVNTIVSLKNYYMSDEKLGERFIFKEVIAWYILNYYHTAISDELRKKLKIWNAHRKIGEVIGNKPIGDVAFNESEVWKTVSEYHVQDLMFIELDMGLMIRSYSFEGNDIASEAS